MRTTYIKLILSAFFWGGSAIAGKFAMAELSPPLTTCLRFSIAGVFLGIIVLAKGDRLKTDLKSHLRLMVLGGTGISLCYYFYFKGLHISSAFNAGLIDATIPLVFWVVVSAKGGAGSLVTGPVSWLGLASTAFMAFGGSALAYIFFNEGVQVLGSSSASSFINVVPFITMVMAITILGEKPTAFQWVGVIVLFVGVKLSNPKPTEEASEDGNGLQSGKKAAADLSS